MGSKTTDRNGGRTHETLPLSNELFLMDRFINGESPSFRFMPSSNLTNYQWVAPTQLVKISESDNKAKAMIQEKGQISKV